MPSLLKGWRSLRSFSLFRLICIIFLVIVMLTIIEVWRSIRVIRCQFRVMRGHMIQNSKMFVLYDILRCSVSFDIHHVYVLRSSEVNGGQSSDLSLVWTYFHCNIAVLSFCLICNMPIFLVIVMFTIIEVWRSFRVIKGQFMVMRGHMIQNSQMLVTCDILTGSAFF